MMCWRWTLLVVTVLSVGVASWNDGHHNIRAHRKPSRPPVLPGEDTREYWLRDAQDAIEARIKRYAGRSIPEKARNVVMFLGDGMSIPTLAAARTLLGQRNGRPGEEEELSFESFPTAGLVKVKCVAKIKLLFQFLRCICLT